MSGPSLAGITESDHPGRPVPGAGRAYTLVGYPASYYYVLANFRPGPGCIISSMIYLAHLYSDPWLYAIGISTGGITVVIALLARRSFYNGSHRGR